MTATSSEAYDKSRKSVEGEGQDFESTSFQFLGGSQIEQLQAYLNVAQAGPSSVFAQTQTRKDETATVSSPEVPQVTRPLVSFAPMPSSLPFSTQKWEGIVLQVKDSTFLAKLIDLTQRGAEEEVEIEVEEVINDDRELLQEGAVFYWYVGYLSLVRGQRITASILRFRRLPAWTEEEIEAARKSAEEIQESIGWK